MRKIKSFLFDLLVGLVCGLVFFGVLFALAEPFMSKCDVVYNDNENTNLPQNNENKEQPDILSHPDSNPVREPDT